MADIRADVRTLDASILDISKDYAKNLEERELQSFSTLADNSLLPQITSIEPTYPLLDTLFGQNVLKPFAEFTVPPNFFTALIYRTNLAPSLGSEEEMQTKQKILEGIQAPLSQDKTEKAKLTSFIKEVADYQSMFWYIYFKMRQFGRG